MASEAVAKLLTDADVPVVVQTMNDLLVEHEPVTSLTVYEAVKDKLTKSIPKSSFRSALTASISTGRIQGFGCCKGPHGGIFREASLLAKKLSMAAKQPTPSDHPTVALPPSENPLPRPAILPPPSAPPVVSAARAPYSSNRREPLKNVLHDEHENFFLFISGERYRVPCNQLYIKSLLDNVLGAKEDPSGDIKFLDRNYSIPDIKKTGVEMFENIIYFFLNAIIVRGSDNPDRVPSVDKITQSSSAA